MIPQKVDFFTKTGHTGWREVFYFNRVSVAYAGLELRSSCFSLPNAGNI
jgi:hypothetical protein